MLMDFFKVIGKMNRVYNVLIIEDHQIVIDLYKRALTFVKNDLENINFNVDDAKCCQSAYELIVKSSKLKNIDLVFLDISLPSATTHNISSGEDLGEKIKLHFPKVKIIVCTGVNDNLKLNNITKKINPDGFLVKKDIDFDDIIKSIKAVLANEPYYSKTVIDFLRKRVSTSIVLSAYDVLILKELSNGARMKEMQRLIPLSKTGIENRKRKLRSYFNVNSDSDRELVMAARENGFI